MWQYIATMHWNDTPRVITSDIFPQRDVFRSSFGWAGFFVLVTSLFATVLVVLAEAPPTFAGLKQFFTLILIEIFAIGFLIPLIYTAVQLIGRLLGYSVIRAMVSWIIICIQQKISRPFDAISAEITQQFFIAPFQAYLNLIPTVQNYSTAQYRVIESIQNNICTKQRAGPLGAGYYPITKSTTDLDLPSHLQ